MAHQRLFKDTLLTLITLVVFGSTNFIFNVVVGRVYGSAYLGMVWTALSTSLLLSYAISTSFPGAVAKYVSEYLGRKRENDANYVLKLALYYGTIIAIAMTIFAVVFADYLCDLFNMSKTIFLLSVPIISLYGIYMILKMAYYGYRNVQKYFKNELVADSLFFIALGAIIIFKWDTYIFLPYLVLYSVFIFSAMRFFNMKLKSTGERKKEIKKSFFAFAGISFIGTFSSMAMRSLSIMISSIYIPASDVGFLSAAFSISAIFFLFPNALGRVLMPEFSYNFGKGNKEQLVSLLNKSTEYLAVFVTIINSLGIIFARLIVWIFYGDKYMNSVLLLQILLMAYWFTMVGRPAVSVLSGTKYIHIPNIGGLLALIITIGIWIFFIPVFGVIGTAVGYYIGVLCNMMIILIFSKKYYSLNLSGLVKGYLWISLIFVPFLINHDLLLVLLLSLGVFGTYLFLKRKYISNLLIKSNLIFKKRFASNKK